MPRTEARLHVDLWVEGLDGLSAHEKLMYCVVLTEPTLNHAGVGAWRESRWARMASLSADETSKALVGLGHSGHVVIDENTEEVFVRTVIRRDGVAEMPFVLKSAIASALCVKSRKIRKGIADELRKLPPQRPDGVSKSGRAVVYPDPHAAADVLDPPGAEGPGRPFREGLETLSEGSQEGSAGRPFRDPLERVGGGGGGSTSSHLGFNSASKRSSAIEERSSSEPPERPDVEQLCEHLRDRVAANGFRTPSGLVNWRRQARLLLDADKRELDEALQLIDWATKDQFWHANIRSMDKFREKYDTLLAQAHRSARPQEGTSSQRANAILALRKKRGSDDDLG